MKLFARQGDVYIFQVDETNKPLEEKRELILAEGEVTGHRHVLIGDRVESKILVHYDGQWWIEGGGGAVVTHQEHAPITLPAGKYAVRIQREYDPVSYARQVVD